jgi:hypothetical protein
MLGWGLTPGLGKRGEMMDLVPESRGDAECSGHGCDGEGIEPEGLKSGQSKRVT